MSRWFLLACCLFVLGLLYLGEPARSSRAVSLGGACSRDRDCQVGLRCEFEPDVMQGQCAAACNATAACQERFGMESVCLGADLCARTCSSSADCPAASVCNLYGWCER